MLPEQYRIIVRYGAELWFIAGYIPRLISGSLLKICRFFHRFSAYEIFSPIFCGQFLFKPASLIESDMLPMIAGRTAGRQVDTACLEYLKTSVHDLAKSIAEIFVYNHHTLCYSKTV